MTPILSPDDQGTLTTFLAFQSMTAQIQQGRQQEAIAHLTQKLGEVTSDRDLKAAELDAITVERDRLASVLKRLQAPSQARRREDAADAIQTAPSPLSPEHLLPETVETLAG